MQAMEKAETAAREVIAWARHHRAPITRDTIDAILTRDTDTPWGDANIRTVRMSVRRIADPATDTVALTDREEIRIHKARFRTMNREELAILAEGIGANPDDKRGWDKNFVQALFAAQKGR